MSVSAASTARTPGAAATAAGGARAGEDPRGVLVLLSDTRRDILHRQLRRALPVLPRPCCWRPTIRDQAVRPAVVLVDALDCRPGHLMTGLPLLRQLGPVLVLGAAEASTVTLLEAGAHDVVAETAPIPELRARVLAASNWQLRGPAPVAAGLRLDQDRGVAVFDGHEVALPPRLLEVLGALGGFDRIVDRAALRRMLDDGHGVAPLALNQRIQRLRELLRQAGVPASVESVRGVGVVLRRAPACDGLRVERGVRRSV